MTIGRFRKAKPLETMKSKRDKLTQKIQKIDFIEWDLSQGMGILPDDISFTQNIGCVGSKNKKEVIFPLNLKK